MAVSSATSRADYTGNGATTVFAYSFKIIANTDLLVTTRDNATGVETTKTLTTHYTVSGVGAAAGGNVTFGTAPTNGHKITIRRVRALTQTTAVRNQGSYYAETHEDAFDHFAMLAQQLQDQIDRCIRLPETEVGTTAKTLLDPLETRVSNYLYYDASGFLTMAAAGTIVPSDAQFVTLAAHGTLANERVLTGTANQVVVTDGGAGAAVTLSTPQSIHTGASPTFAGATLSGLTDTRVLVAGAGGVVTGDAGLTYVAATDTLTVAGAVNVASSAVLADTNGVTMGDAKNIITNTATGTIIAASTAQKVGFHGVAATAQGASVADASGGVVIDTEARAAINALISRMEAKGLIATV